MLECLLFSSTATQDMELTFVNGEHLNIDTGFFSDTWKVHSKWLTWEGAHEQAFCEEDELGTFSCDHAVLQLWDIMISQLIATGEHPRIAVEERWLKSMARIRLSQMPRLVECRQTQKKGELVVRWESTDSHRHKHKTVRVILHRVDCDHARAMDKDKDHLNHDIKYNARNMGLASFQANGEQDGAAAAQVGYLRLSVTVSPSLVWRPINVTFLSYSETWRGRSFLNFWAR